MPKIIKNSIPHILISLIVAPITLLAFTWAGTEFMGNRDVKIYMPALEKKIDIMLGKQDKYIDVIMKNQSDISYMKGIMNHEH